jgi:hypothetical protein
MYILFVYVSHSKGRSKHCMTTLSLSLRLCTACKLPAIYCIIAVALKQGMETPIKIWYTLFSPLQEEHYVFRLLQ